MGAVACTRPVRSIAGPPRRNGQQAGAPKGGICTAVDTVRNAVSRQTNADFGPDPIAREAVAANARLATIGGGNYLLARLDPAIPPNSQMRSVHSQMICRTSG